MKYKNILITVFAVGIILRIIFISVGMINLPVNSDEAILGLMAKRIWLGEFPLMTWVQPHGGTLETYLDGPMYLIFGAGKFTVRLLPFIFSIVFMWLIYLIAREYFGGTAGLMALLLVSIPPVYLNIMATLGISMNWPALLGSATLLYICHRVLYGKVEDRRKILLLAFMGLIGGFTLWVHLLVVCALIAVIFSFFIKDKLFFMRRNFWIFVSFFLIASLPLWFYNFTHHFATFQMTHANTMAKTIANLKTCITFTLPATWGIYLPTYIDSSYFMRMGKGIEIPYALVYVLLLLTAIWKKRKSFHGIFIARGKQDAGIWVLVFFMLLDLAVFCKNSRTNSYSVRYLVPTYIALIPIVGFSLSELRKKSKALFTTALLFILGCSIAGNVMVMKVWAKPDFAEKHFCLPDKRKLISFLRDKGIKHGYTHYWLSYPIVFLTEERIKISPAYDERFRHYIHPYLDEVHSSEKNCYIFHPCVGLSAKWFAKEMSKIGGDYKVEHINSFSVFYDFIPPVNDLETVNKEGFVLDSNYGGRKLPFALDENRMTRWATASPQKPGMFFAIDMQKSLEVGGIILHMGGFKHDFPRGIEIYLSSDGLKWEMVYNNPVVGGGLYWEWNGPRIYTNEEYIRAIFKPVQARWVKIVQTGSHNRFDWSVTGFEILQKK